MTITGIILLVLGFVIRHWLNSRAFYRRNEAGVEEFRSYTSAYLTSLLEGLGRIFGAIMMLAGAGILFAQFFLLK